MPKSICCRRCGCVILPYEGLGVVSVAMGGSPERRMIVCSGCGEEMLRHLRPRAEELAGVGSGR